MMGFIDKGISIKARVDHNPIDEIVYDGGNTVGATQAIVERNSGVLGHIQL
jgi:hypothetical protein